MIQEILKTETEIVLKMTKSESEKFLRELEKLELDPNEIQIIVQSIH